MGKFDAKIEKGAEKWIVTLSGTVDEDADFTPLSLEGCRALQIELENLKGINSCGIREWIKWMQVAGQAPITLVKCPKIIIDQINMVEGFLPPSGKVQSFFVPYYNDEMGSEKNVLFTYGAEFVDGQVKAPESVKDADGHDMEMDVIESKYFKFIKK